jgi:Ulp1 family protease
LFQFDFDNYLVVLVPFNSGDHWELSVVFPADRNVTYLNPLGELDATRKTILNGWRRFFNSRAKSEMKYSNRGEWTDKVIAHAKQLDSHSCGIHVVKVCCAF